MQLKAAFTTLVTIVSSAFAQGETNFAIAYNEAISEDGLTCGGTPVGTAFHYSGTTQGGCIAAPGAQCVRYSTVAGQKCSLFYATGGGCGDDGAALQGLTFEQNTSGAAVLEGAADSIEFMCYSATATASSAAFTASTDP